MNKSAHLTLVYPSYWPSQTAEEFEQTVAADGLALSVRSQKPTLVASMEWLLPTAFAVFIAKAYFDGFLKEAGKDHYVLLKQGLCQLFARTSAAPIKTMGSLGKVEAEPTYSHIYSVWAQADDKRRFKLLVPTNLSNDDANQSIDIFLEFLAAFHSRTLDSATSQFIAEARQFGGTILVRADLATRQITLVDPLSGSHSSPAGP